MSIVHPKISTIFDLLHFDYCKILDKSVHLYECLCASITVLSMSKLLPITTWTGQHFTKILTETNIIYKYLQIFPYKLENFHMRVPILGEKFELIISNAIPIDMHKLPTNEALLLTFLHLNIFDLIFLLEITGNIKIYSVTYSNEKIYIYDIQMHVQQNMYSSVEYNNILNEINTAIEAINHILQCTTNTSIHNIYFFKISLQRIRLYQTKKKTYKFLILPPSEKSTFYKSSIFSSKNNSFIDTKNKIRVTQKLNKTIGPKEDALSYSKPHQSEYIDNTQTGKLTIGKCSTCSRHLHNEYNFNTHSKKCRYEYQQNSSRSKQFTNQDIKQSTIIKLAKKKHINWLKHQYIKLKRLSPEFRHYENEKNRIRMFNKRLSPTFRQKENNKRKKTKQN